MWMRPDAILRQQTNHRAHPLPTSEICSIIYMYHLVWPFATRATVSIALGPPGHVALILREDSPRRLGVR
jgi:hypothetical protein